MSAALVDRLVAAHNAASAEDLAANYAAGASVFMDGWDEAIDVPSWVGVFDGLRESYPDLRLERGPVTTGDGVVMTEVRLSGTNTGPLNLGIADRVILRTDAEQLPPTGLPMELVGLVVLEHVDEKVTAERHYWPTFSWLAQLGLVTLAEPVG